MEGRTNAVAGRMGVPDGFVLKVMNTARWDVTVSYTDENGESYEDLIYAEGERTVGVRSGGVLLLSSQYSFSLNGNINYKSKWIILPDGNGEGYYILALAVDSLYRPDGSVLMILY